MSGANYHTFYGVQDAADATGDGMVFAPGSPVEIIRWGFIADALIDVGTTMIVALDKTNSGGTRGDGDVGTITTGTDDILKNDGIYTENVSPGVTLHPTEPHKLIPGEFVTLQVTDAADTAGTFIPFIEYRKLPFVGDSLSGDDGLANLLKVTS